MVFHENPLYFPEPWFDFLVRAPVITHATEERGRLPLSFFKNRKKCPDCLHLWIKFSIPNVVLRVSRRKNISLAFFSCVF